MEIIYLCAIGAGILFIIFVIPGIILPFILLGFVLILLPILLVIAPVKLGL